MSTPDYSKNLADDLVHLARLALTGRPQDVHIHIRRLAKRYRSPLPDTADRLLQLLREAPTRSSPFRQETAPAIPVDLDSRLELIRVELSPELDVEPIFAPALHRQLRELVEEHQNANMLEQHGLVPTRTALFTGAPGVGKTLAARWIARELKRPLLKLDLAAVMSSYLGRTGNNLRYVLDYAKSLECVLLLDELDAIAKRRDDSTEVGELKRLVTVLLQEVDDWPAPGLLIAATNHPDLLDPAMWRRFDVALEFPLPDEDGVAQAVSTFLGSHAANAPAWEKILASTFQGASFSDIERQILHARRIALLRGGLSWENLQLVLEQRLQALSRDARRQLALDLVNADIASQRQAQELTGVSRDTIRRALREQENGTHKGTNG